MNPNVNYRPEPELDQDVGRHLYEANVQAILAQPRPCDWCDSENDDLEQVAGEMVCGPCRQEDAEDHGPDCYCADCKFDHFDQYHEDEWRR